METLDGPEVTKMPDLAPNEGSPTAFADMVLTSLFCHAPALLHAEYRPRDAAVTWFVRPIRGETDQRDIPVAELEFSGGYFRAVLARFGAHYMASGQLYGGYTLRSLGQHGRAHRCHIYMSNNGQSGFWIRVYATVG